jgi:G3E family GTPase
MLALPNGCLCCSVKDLGIAAIEDMVAAQREKIDWVVVELTGLADPAPIAKSFWANEEMGDLELDSVVCVVDSRNVLKVGPSLPLAPASSAH